MFKPKPVERWVAWLEYGPEKEIKTALVKAYEVSGGYTVDPNELAVDHLPWQCVNYQTVIGKDDKILFETELGALMNLDETLIQEEQLATARAQDAQENLYLITEALENHATS